MIDQDSVTRQTRSEVTRTKIVDAALELIRQNGFARVSTREIATEAHVSHGSVFYHFPDREAILVAAFEAESRREIARVESKLRRVTTPQKRLDAFVRSYAPVKSTASFRMWIDAWSELAHTEQLLAVTQVINLEWHRCLASLLSGASPGIDAKQAAWKVLCYIDGLQIYTQIQNSVPRSKLHTWALDFIDAQLQTS